MSRFTTTIKCLEDKIYQQVRLAQELEVENAKLQHKEQALCLTLASLQGSMSAMGDRHRLQQAQDSFRTAGPTPVASTGSQRATATSNSSSSSSCPPLELPAAGTDTASGSTADAFSSLSGEDPAACWMDLQQQLVVMEQLLQGDRQQVLGVASTRQQAVTSSLVVEGPTGAVGSWRRVQTKQAAPWCDTVTLAAATTAALLPRCCCVQPTQPGLLCWSAHYHSHVEYPPTPASIAILARHTWHMHCSSKAL